MRMKVFEKVFLSLLLVSGLIVDSLGREKQDKADELKIGWAEVDITPSRPVLVAGQFHARVSEGVMDPVTATVLAIESTQAGKSIKTLMISCDLVGISDGSRSKANLRDRIRE